MGFELTTQWLKFKCDILTCSTNWATQVTDRANGHYSVIYIYYALKYHMLFRIGTYNVRLRYI